MAEHGTEKMLEAAEAFQIEGTFKSSGLYGNGHINSTTRCQGPGASVCH